MKSPPMPPYSAGRVGHRKPPRPIFMPDLAGNDMVAFPLVHMRHDFGFAEFTQSFTEPVVRLRIGENVHDALLLIQCPSINDGTSVSDSEMWIFWF